jgi:hypothetical protein
MTSLWLAEDRSEAVGTYPFEARSALKDRMALSLIVIEIEKIKVRAEIFTSARVVSPFP